jgi:hypothetical protein
MTAFNRGDRVVFNLGHTDYTGTIERPATIGGAPGYYVNGPGAKPGPWLVFTEDIIPIPDGTTILTDGTRVQVAVGAPHYAGRVGIVESPEVRNGMFGYWLLLSADQWPAWVPAEVLTALDGGEPS